MVSSKKICTAPSFAFCISRNYSIFATLKKTVMKIFKKKSWVVYLIMFVVLAVAYFLADWLISGLSLRRAIIGGLVGSVIITILFWFFDEGIEQIKKSNKKDKSEE